MSQPVERFTGQSQARLERATRRRATRHNRRFDRSPIGNRPGPLGPGSLIRELMRRNKTGELAMRAKKTAWRIKQRKRARGYSRASARARGLPRESTGFDWHEVVAASQTKAKPKRARRAAATESAA